MGFGMTRISAQNSRDVYNWPVDANVVTFEIFCNGQLIDVLTNATPYLLKCRDKYKDGDWVAYNQHLNNIQFESLQSGETFKCQGREMGTIDVPSQMAYGNMMGLFIGNKGSKYMIEEEYELNLVTWEMKSVSSNTVCH
jgi:hypothetical protein